MFTLLGAIYDKLHEKSNDNKTNLLLRTNIAGQHCTWPLQHTHTA